MLFVYFIVLLTFASTMVLLNLGLRDDDEQFLADVTKFSLLDSFVASYLVGLGQFNPDYNGPNAILCWIMFLLSTIVSLIIFMNMIIAQMGDSFEEAQGKREIIIYQSRVQLISEFIFVAEKKLDFANSEQPQFLYLVERI